MKKEELVYIVGGASISGSMISAIYSVFVFLLDLGERAGSVIRRYRTGKYC